MLRVKFEDVASKVFDTESGVNGCVNFIMLVYFDRTNILFC